MNNEPFGSGNQNENPNAYAETGTPNYDFLAHEAPKQVDGFGIASLITGILSLLCCCLFLVDWIVGILGIIFAFVSYRKMGRFTGLAIAGLVCAVLGTAINAYMLGQVIYIVMADPDAFQQIWEEALAAAGSAGVQGV